MMRRPSNIAGGRRAINKASNKSSDEAHKTSSNCVDTSTATVTAPPIQHVPIPNIPRDGDFVFEVVVVLYSCIALFAQLINLYRTVWWLPHSYTHYAMNTYLVDPYLVTFIVLILARRLMWSVVHHASKKLMPLFLTPETKTHFRIILLNGIIICLIWCATHILRRHPVLSAFYLIYPISVYYFVFDISLSLFLDPVPESSLTTGNHFCPCAPVSVRDGVDSLKSDFNNRIKQILFHSFITSYYTTLVPCCFAQKYLHYDVYWASQHILFTFIGTFTMHVTHCCSPKYCDLFHQTALHLGKWIRIEGRPVHIPCVQWTDNNFWRHGSLVKYQREVYRAEGTVNCAEPGNASHGRFYKVFQNPSSVQCGILGLHLVMVIVQLGLLINSGEWHQMLSLSMILFANYAVLFRVARDYLVLWKVYRSKPQCCHDM